MSNLVQQYNNLGNFVNMLQVAIQEYDIARSAIEKTCKSTAGEEMYLPISKLAMMKGQLSEPKKVCVDVGTGYFIVMSPKRAINYFERKIKELEGNINQAMESRQVILQQIKSIKESASTE